MAKQLSPHAPRLSPLTGLWENAPGVRGFLILILPAWLGGAIAAVRLDEADKRRWVLGLLATPLPFFAVQCTMTDWPLWYWYVYPCVVTGALGAALLASSLGFERRDSRRLVLALLAGVALLLSLKLAARAPDNWIHRMDKALARQIADEPGRYAMGDCAGTLAHLTPHPVMQTEGLVMDAGFVQHIANERDLIAVLQDYAIDVHLTLRAERIGDCWQVTEPALAGPASPRLRGRFCSPPLFVVSEGDATVHAFRVPAPSN